MPREEREEMEGGEGEEGWKSEGGREKQISVPGRGRG